MSEITSSRPLAGRSVVGLRLSEERAAAGYLAARKAMVTAGTRALSLGRLAGEHPGRADYRDAWHTAQTTHQAAQARTEIAYRRWLAAQMRTDDAWTATTGRAAA